MEDKKHIDRLFQEKFKDFEVSPRPELWDGINERLHPKKKRRVIPIWWWSVGGVAAALILFFALGGINSFDANPDKNLPIVDIDLPKDSAIEKSNPENSNTDSKLVNESTKEDKRKDSEKEEQNIMIEKSSTIFNGKTTNSIVENNSGSKSSKTTTSKANTKIINDSRVATNSTENKNAETISEKISKPTIDKILKSSESESNSKITKETRIEDIISEEKLNEEKEKSELLKKETTIESAIAEANDINEEEKEKLNRWSIAPSVAPVYFNSLTGGSAIDSQFNDNAHQSDVTMSYGISGAYNINPRLKIKAGVHRVEFKQTTKDILSSSGSDFATQSAAAGIENISMLPSGNEVTLLSASIIARSSVPEALNSTPTGDIDQLFGFIEIPVSLEYRLIDKKIGVNVSGGFSTFFLNSNEIYTDIDGNNTMIGTANNLNDMSYSANFGIGFNYGISKKIDLNLEPTFKYQINTFNNTSGNFRPFFIGVYTGLSFKF